MIHFFRNDSVVFAFSTKDQLSDTYNSRLNWLFGGAIKINETELAGWFIGPRREMVTPWSTNAVEISQNMGIEGIQRMEQFIEVSGSEVVYDPMLSALYHGLDQLVFTVEKEPDPILFIDDIAAYNQNEGLALSNEEVSYLEELSLRIGRKLTDGEVYGFAQVNSEHCRHKIFNGTFVIDGTEMPESLFSLIKKTSEVNHNRIVSAYKDNVAFVEGPEIWQFAPLTQDKPDFFGIKKIEAVISLKAETHNFPTTVEPFNGAATGSGGEIRDRMAGGKGSLPLAGTAVYMTSYPRLEAGRLHEEKIKERKWLYQTPLDILIKASNGASDFGNKFGQPLICGSLLTFEHAEQNTKWGYDKVIMLAGGVGFGKKADAQKEKPQPGDQVIVMGGDNYRIGMGGGAVSSVATGQFSNNIELNAVQRSNPEMQKRVFNAIRAMAEADQNPIVSIHDHGAGGHLNSLSELVEETGAVIEMDKLPVGDPTLSDKEIIGNESQERMGLILKSSDTDLMKRVSERERAPFYVVGEATGDHRFTFRKKSSPIHPLDLALTDFFGKPPKTVLYDNTLKTNFSELTYSTNQIHTYLEAVLQLESVACKDWLTNKVDRSVTGKIAQQQCVGEIQLPLANLGVTVLDYHGEKGIATSIGHAPAAGLIDPAKGAILAIAESLTNLVWAPLQDGIRGISLSANWMWPARNEGENARLYAAVKAASAFAIALGINIPTGKDSLSMTQKYPDNEKVFAPGTVIISAVAEVTGIKKTIRPVLKNDPQSEIIYIPFTRSAFELGGSSFAQVLGQVGTKTPDVPDPDYFKLVFTAIQQLVNKELILAGHDVSSGGLITTLLEMTFPSLQGGLYLATDELNENDPIRMLFSEKPGVIIQVKNSGEINQQLKNAGVEAYLIGRYSDKRTISLNHDNQQFEFDIDSLRELWFKTSYLFERHQTVPELALKRFANYKKQPLAFRFHKSFTGSFGQYSINPLRRHLSGIKAAIIREKGVNGDREMAWSLYLAGFDVKDVHTTDLISGRETLKEINFIVFVGGFSNSDVLGSGKGWAGALLYNEKARKAITTFYQRTDTLSLGICNGCQVMTELGLIYPEFEKHPRMMHNSSGKFESAFLNVDIVENNSVMLKTLAGSRLGIWVAHGEGKFYFPAGNSGYLIPVKYSHDEYPGNPNGSPDAAAGIVSADGRHLAMMPHLERAIYPWQWAFYPENRKSDQFTPWLEAFVNARKWVESKLEK
ncbi:MAG TPA: phosphoribosylformylglycinamidine synthase [Bacteroidales bacterium]|nr:phosphoribosylformylglycinamidine synthase [Bacteroidales bacterium]